MQKRIHLLAFTILSISGAIVSGTNTRCDQQYSVGAQALFFDCRHDARRAQRQIAKLRQRPFFEN